jgi:hypothetical protein
MPRPGQYWLLALPQTVGSAAMTKDDFANQGFSILLPEDPHHEAALQELGLLPNAKTDQPSFSVFGEKHVATGRCDLWHRFHQTPG